MTKRALFWCGYAHPTPGRFAAPGAADAAFSDAITLANDLELAVEAARNLGVEDRNMFAFVCDRDLLPAGYRGERFVPTIAAFEQVILRIAKAATAADATLFYATNHGIQEGLLTSARVDELELDAPSLLTPEELARALDNLLGVHALVIAACFAGVFLPLAEPGRRLVLAACSDTEVYYVGSTTWAGFPAELFRAWCGVSPDQGECPARMDLDAAFDFAEQRVTAGLAGRVIKPHRAGSIHWPR